MISGEFFNALFQIQEEKGVPRELVLEAVEQALLAAYRKKCGPTAELKVEFDEKARNIKVYSVYTVVEDGSFDPIPNKMEYSEAKKYKKDPVVGEQLLIEVCPEDIGRIAAQTVKQVVIQRIREAERDLLYNEYSKKINELLIGTVHRVEARNLLIDLGKTEAILPASEQIPHQQFKVGDQIKVSVLEVRKTTKGPLVFVTRASAEFLAGLFRYYIPEVASGVVQIKGVVREAGARTKIAVWCAEPKIDPVGACVGLKGSRIKDIVGELSGEKIDIIMWNEDLATFITNSLSPAKVVSIQIAPDKKSAQVVVPDNQLSLAIGKEGQNVRLAAKLTGCKIDIKSESAYKEYLNQLLAKGIPEEAPESLVVPEKYEENQNSRKDEKKEMTGDGQLR